MKSLENLSPNNISKQLKDHLIHQHNQLEISELFSSFSNALFSALCHFRDNKEISLNRDLIINHSNIENFLHFEKNEKLPETVQKEVKRYLKELFKNSDSDKLELHEHHQRLLISALLIINK